MSIVQTVKYSYRAEPDERQKQVLTSFFDAARWAYNDYLGQYRDKRAGKISQIVPASASASKIPESKKWVKSYPSKTIQQAVRTAQKAIDDFFKGIKGQRKNRVGFPHFKKKGIAQDSITWNGKGSIAIEKINAKWASVRIPKDGSWLKFRLSRDLPSDPTGVTLKRDKLGNYTVSFTVKRVTADTKYFGPVSGVDLGLIDLASVVNSDGERYKIANPRHLRKAERSLRRAQQNLSRKQKGSKNREKARLRLAKQNQKVANTRKDFHRKIALKLASENQVVALEDLSIEGMKQNRRLAKSVSDASLGFLRGYIEQAGQKVGCQVEIIDRWAPTSQICCVCGCVPEGKKDLSVREWECPDCSAFLDRDFNAAVNIILAAGLAESLNDCGENVRLQLAGADLDEAVTSCSGSV